MAGAIFALVDGTPDRYLDHVPAITLASMNLMSMFGLQRRLRGAVAGHVAAFEMTSSVPSKYYGTAFRKLGYGPEVTWYVDEHVEADAVHEQIAVRDLAGALAQDGPYLVRGDVLIAPEPGAQPQRPTRRTVALCRCNMSGIAPFCDGSHKLAGFRTRPPQRDLGDDAAEG